MLLEVIDSTKSFLEQITKYWHYDIATCKDDYIYTSFLQSLSTRDRDNFIRFFNIYANKVDLNIRFNDVEVNNDPLVLACLKLAMEYYFL